MQKYLRHATPWLIYAVAALALPNIVLCATEHMPWWACAANVLLPVPVYALLLTLARKPGKAVLMCFPIVFFAAFQIVLIFLYGRGVIAVDMFLNLVTTNPGEAMELLDNLVPAIAFVVAVYVPLIVVAAVSWRRGVECRPECRRRVRRWSLVFAACGLAVVAMCRVCGAGDDVADADEGNGSPCFAYRVTDHLYPVNVIYNLWIAVQRTRATAHYRSAVATFRFGARPTHAADSSEVYVLVVGETARAVNFQLYGYSRPTTPLLAATPGIDVFRGVTSQSNTTHKSVPMILSAATASDHDRLYREKSIISAFREAGFHTVFLSAQRPNHSFIDFFGQEADEWRFAEGQNAAQSGDMQLLPSVAKVLNCRRRKQLIVMHTYGSHFNYRDRYPRSQAYFRPDAPSTAAASNRAALLNAYDNTIRQTDRLLHSIITLLNRRGCAAAMIYTSDHGENIFDDPRQRFLHASPVPSFFDTNVPLIVWTSPSYRRQYNKEAEALQRNRDKGAESSVSVFHTMLQLAGIAAPQRNDTLSLASTCYRMRRRRYLDDHDRAVTFSVAGMTHLDFLQFRRHRTTGY